MTHDGDEKYKVSIIFFKFVHNSKLEQLHAFQMVSLLHNSAFWRL